MKTSISLKKINGVLLLLFLTATILYFGKTFLVPLCFSALLVMLLLPICRKLEKWGIGRIWASLMGILIIVMFVGLLVWIVAAQASRISEDIPKLQANTERMMLDLQSWIESRYGMAPQEQLAYVDNAMKNLSASAGRFFGSMLSSLMGFLTGFVLVLLYFFFIMWKREKYSDFALKLVSKENRPEVKKELNEITHVAENYLIGRMVSMVFLAIFYMVGFSIAGLENGILIALVAVIPTIIPYVGSFIGGFFPVAMAFLSGSPDMVLPIVLILVTAQIIDNNIIEPMAEGESLDLSPIFVILALAMGGSLWGIAGMILFIPMFAIVKIICDHIPALEPYGFLMTNDVEEPMWVEKIKGWFGKGKRQDLQS